MCTCSMGLAMLSSWLRRRGGHCLIVRCCSAVYPEALPAVRVSFAREQRAHAQGWLDRKHRVVNRLPHRRAHRHPLRTSHAPQCHVTIRQLNLLPPAELHDILSASAAIALSSDDADWRSLPSGPGVARLLLASSHPVAWLILAH